MTAIDLTNSPSNGTTATVDGRTYTYNSTTSRWELASSSSASSLSTEQVQDIVGAQLVTNGSHTGISFAYDDSGDAAIDATVGTLNQNTTGSAATLTTPRNIGGVAFDGSADINLPGVNAAGTQNTTGSATTLTTPRNIGGVAFDGSADIIPNIVTDTTPQLGGPLDVNGQGIVTVSNGDIDLDPNGSGVVAFKGNATKGAGQFKLNCENNSHGITIKGPPHSASASYTLTLPNNDGDANQVLKTDGSGVLSWTTPAAAGASSIDDLSDAVYNSTALSLFLGANAGAAVTNSANANVAVGVNAGDSITSANMNVLLGYNAGNAITTGSKNIVIGGQAYNTTSSNGSHNILIGYNAEATSTSTNNEMTIGTASGDGLINNVRIPGVDFTMNTTALHYGAEIRADGDVVAYYSSDERLKENVQIISNAVSKVQQIRGVTFDWKDEYLKSQGGEDDYFHRKHDSGVIAQDVEKVLPELVAERKDGTKAVRYEKLVAVLIEAVKELKQEIENLKGEK